VTVHVATTIYRHDRAVSRASTSHPDSKLATLNAAPMLGAESVARGLEPRKRTRERTRRAAATISRRSEASASARLAAAADGVFAGFLVSRGLFGAVLHQFLSAETIQVSQERILLKVFGSLFLSHSCTLLEWRPRVNFTDSGAVAQLDLAGDGRQGHATLLAMKLNSKELGPWPIVWAIVWALAIIATAFLFKGKPAEYWIESGLIVGALAFVVLKSRRPSASAR